MGYDSERFSSKFLWFLVWGEYYEVNGSVSGVNFDGGSWKRLGNMLE